MIDYTMDRRSLLKWTGLAAASGGVTVLAGCQLMGDDADEDDDQDDELSDAVRIDDDDDSIDDDDPDRTDEDAIDTDIPVTIDPSEHWAIEYDRIGDPTDVYRVWSGQEDLASFVDDSGGGDRLLEIVVREGGSAGTNAHVRFPEEGLGQPREVYQSCWVGLSENWTMAPGDQCKMFRIGLNSEAGPCGTGSRCVPSGNDGWSASVVIRNRDTVSENAYGFGTYHYHMDGMSELDPWENGPEIGAGEWIFLETYVRMNTISNGEAVADGELAVWVDGTLAYDRTGLRWTTSDQAIEYVGPYVTYGGSETAPRDMAVFYDHHRLVFSTDHHVDDQTIISVTGHESINEYGIRLEGGTVEAGDSANIDDDEFPDRVFEDNGTWYIHGYVSDAGIDDYVVIDSELTGVEYFDGDPELFVNGDDIDPGEYDSIDGIPTDAVEVYRKTGSP